MNIDAKDIIFEALPFPALLIDAGKMSLAKINKAAVDFFSASSNQPEEILEKNYPSFIKDKFTTDQVNQITASLTSIFDGRVEDRVHLNSHSGSTKEPEAIVFIHKLIHNSKDQILQIIIKLDEVLSPVSNSDKQTLKTENIALQGEIVERSQQLEITSKELNDFVYSVSHDLRAPLRRIDGFSQELAESYLDQLDDLGQHYIKRIRQGAQDMGNLIDDLLKLSRISRRELDKGTVNLAKLGEEVFNELSELVPQRSISFKTTDNLSCYADPGLIKIVLYNLISNAIKFTQNSDDALIEIGSTQQNGTQVFYIKDNGVGFDMAYSDKLFKAFQRLHSHHEYEGNGIGLVTVKRIITSHGGRIWADSTPGEGATFYFTLKQKN